MCIRDSFNIPQYITKAEDLMKKLLGLTLTLGGVGAASCLYLNSRIQEESIAGGTLYYKEYQDKYTDIKKHFVPFIKTMHELKPSYDKQHFSLVGLYFDNPGWLVDQNKSRTAIGFLTYGGLEKGDRERISAGMTGTSLPPFKAMTIPMCWYGMKTLYPVYMWLLMRMYIKKNLSLIHISEPTRPY
eukprot:TRINITY_DN2450_c0_g1_i5.p1 TRINITY_DN2450_c0_g1~~TRINITY_DN2450_c0_g1_i5.p1  ORF type:complete len:186 (+),score=51.80 TRINITY_DN2450_c0_g1_i5:71-628(+)